MKDYLQQYVQREGDRENVDGFQDPIFRCTE